MTIAGEELFVDNRFPKEELVKETFNQVRKELLTEGFDLEFSGQTETAYSELMQNLTPVMEVLLKDPGRLFRLLYRIDISEETFVKAHSDDSPAPALAHLFLRRSMEKVILRKLYS